MAIGASTLTSGYSTSSATSYDTASISPTGNYLILIAIYGYRLQPGVAPAISGVSGNGITYVQIASIEYKTTDTVLWLYRGMASSPSTGAITISFSTGCDSIGWVVSEFSGVDTSGTNGSGAVVQSATNSANGQSLTVTLSAFGSSNNRPFGCFSQALNPNLLSPETGYTELAETGDTADHKSVNSQWHSTSADTTVTCNSTGGVDVDMGGIAIEVKEAAAGGVTIPVFISSYKQRRL